MDQYLATIMMFGGNFAINGWQLCYGQTLSISQYSALFAILGTTYGGNGTTTFQLPDLQGRVPVGMGNGIGLSPYVIGQKSGTENTSLTINNLPSHVHTAGSISVSINVSNAQATASVPVAGTATLSAANDPISTDAINLYSNGAANVPLTGGGSATGNTGSTGNNIPISIVQPYLCVNFQIALVGIFPSRN